ncbi:MAG: UDP-N-acetylmuramate:L-alanyl-gamma-D-glutamyl-meso-diaminopimelate ligase [Thermodesulfobacteriota bacterium]
MGKNVIPEKVESIHMIAICGTGMGALALMLKDLGFAVTGSDLKVYPPMSEFLTARGIDIAEGFRPEHLSYGPDLVIVGNAVSKDNPEVVHLGEMGLPYCSMPQAINRFVAAGKKQILIAGTHGKTTTSSIVAWILDCAGLDETFFIGGILANFNSNYRLGHGDYIVIEGDEYDTAFFDKGPKFLHYNPHAAILTSVEFDHADIFRDEDHVLQVFRQFAAGLDGGSTLFTFDGDANVAKVTGAAGGRVVGYGKSKQSGWRLGSIELEPPWSRFEVLKDGVRYGRFETMLVGEHNLLNALSAIAVADLLGIPGETIDKALATFKGVRRRQEVRGVKNGIVVMDDFAHHPTAVRETVRAVKPFYPDGRLIAVFEPRTNTSMRDVFQHVYPACFDMADLICIRKPPLLKKIPEGQQFSSQTLVQDLIKRGKDAHYFETTDLIIAFIKEKAVSGDAILVMSNGGFDNIHQRLLEAL